jgi:phage protein U
MRSIKLVGALAAAAALLVTAAPGTSIAARAAAKHPSPNGRCDVNVNVAPRVITSGDAVLVFGRLRCRGRVQPPSGAGSKTVKLLEHSVGTPGFTVVQSTTTDARGFYEFTVPAVQFNSVFYVRSHGATSARKEVRVASAVTLTGPPDGTQLFTGAANKVTFSGTVSPADEGARVILQRQNAEAGNDWHRIDVGRVGPSGAFSITHTFVAPGDANLRVLVRSRGRNIPSPSNVLTYEISQAQNPGLTIQASADPISYGQPVTISGTLTAGAKMPVTLLAHTARQHGFAPVSEVTTDGSGNYTFPSQAPVNSTFYEVKGAGKVSAVLYEGVKDVLTAQVSQSTVQAGESVTFSGTVAPDHTGHVIFLERQNLSGMGFHVVQLGTVSAGSSYSIKHTLYEPGARVFRVMIPGGPENAGAASPPFTITVTPGVLALAPEVPGNSSLPAEGQS